MTSVPSRVYKIFNDYLISIGERSSPTSTPNAVFEGLWHLGHFQPHLSERIKSFVESRGKQYNGDIDFYYRLYLGEFPLGPEEQTSTYVESGYVNPGYVL